MDGRATTEQSGPKPESGSLDLSDPRIEAAREAEERVYDHFGREYTEHVIPVEELGLRMRVVETGTGPPIVLIPGANGVGLEWVPLLPELPGYTLYIMDRPGGGFSDEIDHRSLSFRYQAVSATKALFDHFDLDTAPLVGNSVGGYWAITFNLEHPDRVSLVALLGRPACYLGTSTPLPMRLGSVPVIGGILFDRFMQPHDSTDAQTNWEFLGQSDETIERLPKVFAEAWYRMQNLPHTKLAWVSLFQTIARVRGSRPSVALTPENLRNVTVPVLLIWGANDPFGTVEQGNKGSRFFSDVEFHEVGVGHLPWLDDPERCGELLLEFVARHG